MYHFDALTDFLDCLREKADIPACECAVTLEGELAYHHCAGFSDAEGTRPASPSDTYWLYSATKVATCTAGARLLEEGRMRLTDPVAAYLPEFRDLTVRDPDGTVRPARTELLIGHLFTMTGGLDYDLAARPHFQEALRSSGGSTRELAAALAADPLRFDPGAHYLYSMAHDVLGAVIGAVTGGTLGAYIEEAVTAPLGMKDVTFHPTAEQRGRLSAQFAHTGPGGAAVPIGQGNPYVFSDRYESGGAGLLATASDYVKLPAALSLGGTSAGGYRLLRPETVELMRAPRLTGAPLRDFLARSPADRDFNYGLGVRVLTDGSRTAGTPGQFGWDGAAGAFLVVDPAHRAALLYVQHVCQSGPTFQRLHPALRELFDSCLTGKRPGKAFDTFFQ